MTVYPPYTPPDFPSLPPDNGDEGESPPQEDPGGYDPDDPSEIFNEIPGRTACLLQVYGDLGMQVLPGFDTKRSNLYRYRRRTSSGALDSDDIKVSLEPLRLDPQEWGMVGGVTTSPPDVTVLYAGAFDEYRGDALEGRHYNQQTGEWLYNSVQDMSAEEYALFVLGHEAAHQNGVDTTGNNPNAPHRDANFYGISAVKRYRNAKAEGGPLPCQNL